MKTHILPLLLLTMVIAATAGCGSAATERTLARADSLMAEHPDSALLLLQAIEPSALRADALRARHALLLSRALDLNGAEVPDSTIKYAVEYYDRRSESLPKAMAHYYMGRSLFARQDYSNSLVEMLMAHNYAKQSDQLFWIAISARGMSDVYNETQDPAQERYYAQIAYENFKNGGFGLHAAYGLLDIAISDFNGYRIQDCVDVLPEVIAQSDSLGNDALRQEAKSLYCQALCLNNDFADARRELEQLAAEGIATAEDSAFLGLAYLETGHAGKATEILNSLNDTTLAANQLLNYLILEKEGRTENALQALKKINHNVHDIYHSRIDKDLTTVLRDYYIANVQLKTAQYDAMKKSVYALIFAGVMLAVAAAAVFVVYKRRQTERFERKILIAREIGEAYKHNLTKANAAMHELVRERFRYLDSICATFYETSETKNGRVRIYNEVEAMIARLSDNEDDFRNLIALVDKHMDNLATDFFSDMPHVRPKDARLFVYSALGFSTNAIALFLKEAKPSSVYDRRRHLKDKLRKLPGDKATRYINAMG